MMIASRQLIKFSAVALEGSRAYGILLKGNSTVQLEGTNVIDIAGFANSYGIAAEGGSMIGMGTGSVTQIHIDGYLVS
jgi:hypothetical protein